MRSGGWQQSVSYLAASSECEESAAAISSLEKVTQVKSDTWCQHYSRQPPAGIWLLVFHNFDINVHRFNHMWRMFYWENEKIHELFLLEKETAKV